LENLGWSSTMQSYSSRPPDPALVGADWRQIWAKRLQNQPLLIETWLSHQRRDDYWKHGSVAEDYGAIKAAVLTVGGWGDGYRNTMDHLARHLSAPVKAIAGPWVHKYPHFAKPGPQTGFLQECLRWWDRWLKDIDTGVEQDPAFRAYMMESARPATDYECRAGRWISDDVWPSQNLTISRYHLTAGGLDRKPGGGTQTICSPQTTGLSSGEYSSFGSAAEWPGDQRIDDAGSLVFDSQALAERVEIFGAAVVNLTVRSTQPQANLVVRLSDLAGDGAATRISFGMLNLCHRESHEKPSALDPRETYRVRITLDQIAYAVPAGHKLRIAISTAYWPFIWPSPQSATVTLDLAESDLELPVRVPSAHEIPPAFGAVEHAPPQQLDTLQPPKTERRVEINQVDGRYSLHVLNDTGRRRDRLTGLETSTLTRERFTILPDDPLSAVAETWWTQTLGRDDWHVRTEAYSKLTASATDFLIEGRLQAYDGQRLFQERRWQSKRQRDFM
jgi:predicted acyl esterase